MLGRCENLFHDVIVDTDGAWNPLGSAAKIEESGLQKIFCEL